MKKQITPCLWFNGQAKEAGAFYSSHFANAKIVAQSPIITEIAVSGHHITLLDGGPMYQPNASISLFYVCETEAEITGLWNAFSEGGAVVMPLGKYDWGEKHGWLNDKYGVSWQFWLGKVEEIGQRLIPCFSFGDKAYGHAEDALNYYSTIFKNPQPEGIVRYGSQEAPNEEGKVKHAQMAFNGQKFLFMDVVQANYAAFSEGVSLTVHCETQDEIDYYWEKLTESGKESMCGWLEDKYGVSWQIIPTILTKIMSNPAKAGKAAQAFMQMRKFDIEKIVQAAG